MTQAQQTPHHQPTKRNPKKTGRSVSVGLVPAVNPDLMSEMIPRFLQSALNALRDRNHVGTMNFDFATLESMSPKNLTLTPTERMRLLASTQFYLANTSQLIREQLVTHNAKNNTHTVAEDFTDALAKVDLEFDVDHNQITSVRAIEFSSFHRALASIAYKNRPRGIRYH